MKPFMWCGRIIRNALHSSATCAGFSGGYQGNRAFDEGAFRQVAGMVKGEALSVQHKLWLFY